MVRITPNAAISLAMALHELGTNALKYGALSAPEGNARLSWELQTDGDADHPSLRLTWSESGGPPVNTPAQEGFGMRMLKKGVAHEFGGSVEVDHAPAGLVCRMNFPGQRVLSHDPQ